MKLKLFFILGLAGNLAHALADIRQWRFSAPPRFATIERPEKKLSYDLCLYQVKSEIEGNPDELGIYPPTGKRSCADESQINSRSAEQRKSEEALSRVFDPVKVLNEGDKLNPPKKDHAQWKIKGRGATRTIEYSRVVGFYYLVKKTPEDKGVWDSFCLAQVHTVDEGEEEEDLLLCNRVEVPAVEGQKKVFTCESIESCVGRKRVEEPYQIGPVAGEPNGKAPQQGTVVVPVSGERKSTGNTGRPQTTH